MQVDHFVRKSHERGGQLQASCGSVTGSNQPGQKCLFSKCEAEANQGKAGLKDAQLEPQILTWPPLPVDLRMAYRALSVCSWLFPAFFFLPHPSAPHGLGNVELCAVCPQCYAPSSALWALNMACPVLHVRLSFPLDSSMTPGIGLNTQKVLNKYSLTYAFSGKRRLCSSPQQPS